MSRRRHLLAWGMKRIRTLAVAVTLAVSGVASAQLLAEVALAPAIASQLFPPMSFPASSLRAVRGDVGPIVARVPDAASWTGWEVYTATGLAAALEPAVVYDVERSLLVAGYFRESTTQANVGGEQHTHIVFSDGAQRALLYLVRTPRELVWLVARGR